MNFAITPENDSNYEEIYNLVKISFQTENYADSEEHEYLLKVGSSEFIYLSLDYSLKLITK